jgi:hypothetical protein
MQPDVQVVAEHCSERISQCGPAGCVETTHALQMSSEVTLDHESRNDGLLEPGDSSVKRKGSEREGLHEPGRNDQVA